MQSEEELSPEELRDLLKSFMPEIPGYRVLRRIGKGGMSQVYLGVQVSLDRQVAIKVMSPEALTDEKTKQRFEQEARTIAKLEHPCIVGIHEVGRTPQGLLYYVLPYLAKGHLGQRDFTQDESRVVDVLRALLSALEYAHARGIVHRDVKAENVLFDNADRPLLTDFGIALSKTDVSRITNVGFAVGSGGYMAPEQARGEAVDGRADLYSVGVLAFELLTGQLPYQNNDPLALALMHAQDPVPRLPADKKHWQAFIDRAMAKSADNRYRNAQQMLAALNQIASGGTASAITAPGMDSVKVRPAWFLPAAALTLGAIAIAWAGYAFLNRQPSAEDFFTVQPEPVAESADTAKVAEPVVTTPAAVEKNEQPSAPAANAPALSTAPATAPVASAPLAIPTTFTLSALPFDIDDPAGRVLYRAKRQLAAERLSQPEGDNASESLLEALKLSPNSQAARTMSAQLIDAFAAKTVSAISSGKDRDAIALQQRAIAFAEGSGTLSSPAMKRYTEGLYAPTRSRLEQQAKRFDIAGVDRTKKLSADLGLNAARFEPLWTQASQIPKKGEQSNEAGERWVLTIPPSANGAGVAFMREEVTVADYRKFAQATGRAASRCRNRVAPITLKARRWDEPGFAQGSDHPVVCVSHADAEAYARWLSQQTGETYRLPKFNEWKQIANYGGGDACREGHVACGARGTASAGGGPASPLGLHGAKGNVREWTADCGASCARRLIVGLGWRDSAGKADGTRSSDFDADVGFDDAGFRLVREVGGR